MTVKDALILECGNRVDPPLIERVCANLPSHTRAQWKAYEELERLLDNTAMLSRRLVRALGSEHPLYKQALEFLNENELTGSPLRDAHWPIVHEENTDPEAP